MTQSSPRLVWCVAMSCGILTFNEKVGLQYKLRNMSRPMDRFGESLGGSSPISQKARAVIEDEESSWRTDNIIRLGLLQ